MNGLVLPFGLTNSGAVFSRILGDLLAGSPGCFHYLDDIMVAGVTGKNMIKTWPNFLI